MFPKDLCSYFHVPLCDTPPSFPRAFHLQWLEESSSTSCSAFLSCRISLHEYRCLCQMHKYRSENEPHAASCLQLAQNLTWWQQNVPCKLSKAFTSSLFFLNSVSGLFLFLFLKCFPLGFIKQIWIPSEEFHNWNRFKLGHKSWKEVLKQWPQWYKSNKTQLSGKVLRRNLGDLQE